MEKNRGSTVGMAAKFANAASEYAKDKELKKEDVRVLQEWTAKQPHLPKISEFKLIFFLQSCYYHIEPAKTAIENYYTVRTHCPEFFTQRDVTSKRLQQHMKVTLIFPLPKPSIKGHTVMFVRLVDFNTDVFNFNEQVKLFDMCVSLAQAQMGCTAGQMLVLDSEGTAFGHLTKVNVTSVKKILFYLQEALPVRIKGVHVINASALTQKFVELAKPFLKKELVELLTLHKTMNTFFEVVSQEALPDEYGGRAGPCRELQEKQIQQLLANGEFFREEERLVVDETKRQGKPKDAGTIFGIEGTFKKLDID